MKFGVREITDVVFKAKSKQRVGNQEFEAGEPVIYFDSAKTSTVESASTTVYAQGGRGNPRIMAWEGDKTATFTFEEALLSPLGFSILSGADVLESNRVAFHETVRVPATKDGSSVVLDLTEHVKNGLVLTEADKEAKTDLKGRAKIYVMGLEDGEVAERVKVDQTGGTDGLQIDVESEGTEDEAQTTTKFILRDGANAVDEDGEDTPAEVLEEGKMYLVDFYVLKAGSEMTVKAGKFAGYYYIEANTLFRRAADGKDVPAQFVIPKGKVQSNFTFTMAGSGDPSTFTFVVDAFPDYTMFDQSCEVLFSLNIAEDEVAASSC